MFNKSIGINNSTHFITSQQRCSQQNVCCSKITFPPINGVVNIETSPSKKQNRINTGKPSGIFIGGGDTGSPERVDALFRHVDEIKRHPECRLSAGGRKYITLETCDGLFSIPCKKISLPSGGTLYAGSHRGRELFSDGRNIYMEDLFFMRTDSFISSMLMLLTQLTRVVSCLPAGLAAVLSVRPPGNEQATRMPMSAAGEDHSANGAPGRQGTPVTSFLFPAAAADDTLWSGPLTSGHIWPDNITSVMADDLDEEEEDDVNADYGITPADHDDDSEEGIPLLQNFTIDGQRRSLHIPIRQAKLLFDRLRYEFNRFSPRVEEGLPQLIALDEFLGDRVKQIFGLGLYLDKHNEALDIILFKLKTETLIKQCLLFEHADPESLTKIGRYTNLQVQVSKYIHNMEERLLDALITVDHESLFAAVELKNGLTFNEALSVIADRYKNAGGEDKNRFVIYYKMIYLMQKAHRHYRSQLQYLKDSTPLDRVLYHSDREIYDALIDEDNELLHDHSIKRIFYIIFEYNRMNHVSIHGNYFMIPGEMTQFGNMFEQDEKALTEEEFIAINTQEIGNFFNNLDKKGGFLDRIFALKEHLASPADQLAEDIQWYKININPYLQIRTSLEENIRVNIGEKAKIIMAGPWRDNFSQRLRDDKILFLLTDIIITLQNAFNYAIKNCQRKNPAQRRFTRAQRLVMAKEAAVRSLLSDMTVGKNQRACLALYEERIKQGHLLLLLNAAAIWRFSNGENDDVALGRLDVLGVTKDLMIEEQILFNEMQNRFKENYTSVYKLKRSNDKTSLEDYYNQFIEYKSHDAFFEAKNQTINALLDSPFDYLDLIFPPKEAYTFKVYSRNYVQNTLTPDNWVSLPAENIGFVSLIKTHSQKLHLISSLSNIAFNRPMSDWSQDDVVQRLFRGWVRQAVDSTEYTKQKVPLEEREMVELFTDRALGGHNGSSIVELFIRAPEENQYSQPSAAYFLSPVKEQTLPSSLITYIDQLNYKTLLEVADISKDMLLDHNWVDYVAATIPFFSVLRRHWNDADNQLAFRDIMFELFDIFIAIFPAGISINRLTHNALMTVFNAAKVRNVPLRMLRRFFLKQMMEIMPELALYSSAVTAENLLSFINPLPFSGRFFSKLDQEFSYAIRHKLDFINESRNVKKMGKERMRSEWRKDMGQESLIENGDGIYTNRRQGAEQHHFIQDENSYFQVYWDKISMLWRVIRPHNVNDFSYAVPVKKSDIDRWALQRSAHAGKASPLFDLNTEGMEFSPLSTALRFEPCANVIEAPAANAEQALAYKNALQYLIAENQDAIAAMLRTNAPNSAILDTLVERLNGRFDISEISPSRLDTDEEDALKRQLINIIGNSNKDIKHRSMSFWQNEHDKDPMKQLVIVLEIDEIVFIIDLIELRPLIELKSNPHQVHFLNDWLRFYQNTIPSTYSLVKYKDFHQLNDAVRFSYTEGAHADRYVAGAYLLREPPWYQAHIIRQNTVNFKHTLPLKRIKRQSLRLAARSVIGQSVNTPSREEFPARVMREAGMLTSQAAKQLTTTLNRARTEHLPVEEYLESVFPISYFDELLKVNEGKLLVILNGHGLLHHVMICIGNGRFAGAGNHFFHSTLADRPAILVAEEMGIFEQNKLKPRGEGESYQVIAGNAHGVPETTATVASRLPFKTVIEHRVGEGKFERIVPLARQEVLLGEAWNIQQINGLKTHIRIWAHGAPFNVNHMDALELSHVIRGLALANPHSHNLNTLQGIELFSCFGGYGGKYSTAQILANELNVPVKAYPAKVSEAIRRRHPNWFTVYTPKTAVTAEGMSPATFAKMDRVRKRHARLHDLMTLISSLRHMAIPAREKRFAATLPSIYINIARLMMGNMTQDAFIRLHKIDDYSKYALFALIDEYAIRQDESDDIFAQAYLDVLYSVEAFKHLTKGKHWQK